MPKIYFDNAATTALDKRVLEFMMPFLTGEYGNPSSIHASGRTSRLAIEESRKKVANLLHCHPAEIFFTSCGTESTNTIFQAAIRSLGCKYIITSPIEHHATLQTAEVLSKEFDIELLFVAHNEDGSIDYDDLEKKISACSNYGKTFVSIMHANNEIGCINDIARIATICNADNVFFHSDMVQTVGHLPISFSEVGVDFASASAHKFHGPKGSGALYVNRNHKINPFVLGGGQERNMRAGTENVAGIVGFAAALDFAIADMETENELTLFLKNYCLEKLKAVFPNLKRNCSEKNALPRLLNIMLPLNEKTEMLQMSLDIQGIELSGGSACSSGALGGSHVINFVSSTAGVPLRISFCKWNTREEVDIFVAALQKILL